MSQYPLPNLDGGVIVPNLEWDNEKWYKEKDNIENPHHTIIDFPRGWGNPWPELPALDDHEQLPDLKNINLRIPKDRCGEASILGYYLSWHIIGVSFQNEYQRAPRNGAELKSYNDELPEENRFGIHICCRTIENYIQRFSTDGIELSQVSYYREYCTFLTLIYVIAHEWGHYRSEVLSFQLTKVVQSVTGNTFSPLSPSYLSYFLYKKRYPSSNFEEVFAEWASLKMGIFNYYMKKPVFANNISNWSEVEATVKYMLTRAISNPNRVRPYSDIRFWLDFNSITTNKILNRLSQNSSSLNRSVNDNMRLDIIKSLKKGKVVDLLMHNQIQFSSGHNFNGIVKSYPFAFPFNPDSLFYHFGDDECMETRKISIGSDKFVRLDVPQSDLGSLCPLVYKVINDLKEPETPNVVLPIKVFTEFLPLDPVYFHA